MRCIDTLLKVVRGIVGFFVLLFIGIIFASSMYMAINNVGYVYFVEKLAENETARQFLIVVGLLLGVGVFLLQKILVKLLVNKGINNSIKIKESVIYEPKMWSKEYVGNIQRTRYGITIKGENYYFKQWFKLNNDSKKDKEFPIKKSSMSLEKQKDIDSYYENFFKDKLALLEIESVLTNKMIVINKEKNIAVKIKEINIEIPFLSLINWLLALPLFLCPIMIYVGLLGNSFEGLIVLVNCIGIILIIKLFQRKYFYIDKVIKSIILKNDY